MEVTLPHNGWRPRPYQLKAWGYLEGGGRHAELVYHRRAGKDDLALHWTAISMMTRVGNYWHCLPLQTQARKALWDAVNPWTGKRRVDEVFPLELRQSTREAEMLIRFKNGSTFQVLGSDNYNSLVGSPPIGLIFSEWALCDPAAWGYLRPILAENGGWVLMNTTPRGRNHAFRTFESASKNPTHFAELLPATDTNVFTSEQLVTERSEMIAEYGEDYGEAMYEQEFLCSWDAPNLGAILGKALSKAEREGRISDAVVYDPEGAPIEISSDIGFRDAASWWVWQPVLGGYNILAHLTGSGKDAEEWIAELEKKLDDEGWTLGRIWMPHDAASKSFRSRVSSLVLFAKAFGEHRVAQVPMTPKVDRINAARVVANRCRWHKTNCTDGLDGLRSWAYEYDEAAKIFSKEPLHNWASHDGDSFSYGALIMRERTAKPGKAKPKSPYTGEALYPEMFGAAPERSRYRFNR